MGRKLINIAGQRFGRFTAVEHVYKGNQWICRCDCGRTKKVSGWMLRSGRTQSCGCLNSELSAARKRTHGMARSPEHIAWVSIKARCFRPSTTHYRHYGGRGITMCDEWRNSFEAFYAAVGPRPSPKHQFDRIDNDGHYEPGNVRWTTKEVQANNTRANHVITNGEGRSMTLAQWCRELSVDKSAIRNRILKGISEADAVDKPFMGKRGRLAGR